MICPHCNSEHEEGAFDNGYFLEGEKIVHVKGEANIWAKLRDEDFPHFEVFWSREAAQFRIDWHKKAEQDGKAQAALQAEMDAAQLKVAYEALERAS
jgi:hypothetical protein